MKKEQLQRTLDLAKFSVDSIDIDNADSIVVEIKRNTYETDQNNTYYSDKVSKSNYEIVIKVLEKAN
jgi:HSP20 family molecular chaperone IbpA